MYALGRRLVACTVLCSLVIAQSITPSNDTIPYSNGSYSQLMITVGKSGSSSDYAIHASWLNDSASAPTVAYYQGFNIEGPILNINASNYNSLMGAGIALICCDSSAYDGGNIDLSTVFNGANSKVNATANDHGNGAIVLYSLQSQWCNYVSTDGTDAKEVFTLQTSLQAQDLLTKISVTSSVADIVLNMSTIYQTGITNGTASNNPTGSAPTTTIAMVILYVITGVITLCFIVIIVTGAIRAHRHPERYRGRLLLGRPGQSRARGLAAAMLDTLPIVKFGDHEEGKPVAVGTNIIELQSGIMRPTTQGAGDTSPNSEASPTVANPELTATADSAETEFAAGASAPATEDATDAGLACSVCTDDFVKGQDIRLLPCKHKFHPECIDPWLLNVSGTCPLCRVDLRPPGSDAAEAIEIQLPPSNFIPGRSPIYVRGTNSGPRGRSSGLGSYLHRALNRQNMSAASPVERMEALRDLRNASRDVTRVRDQLETNAALTDTPTSRVMRRIRGFFGRETYPQTDLEAATEASREQDEVLAAEERAAEGSAPDPVSPMSFVSAHSQAPASLRGEGHAAEAANESTPAPAPVSAPETATEPAAEPASEPASEVATETQDTESPLAPVVRSTPAPASESTTKPEATHADSSLEENKTE